MEAKQSQGGDLECEAHRRQLIFLGRFDSETDLYMVTCVLKGWYLDVVIFPLSGKSLLLSIIH